MCGIAGVIGSNAAQRVTWMLPLLSHRGPDVEGIWSPQYNIALGHTRLAINDLSQAGTQPMVSADQNIVIAVNGEIYNYHELRAKLEGFGAVFNSHCDSEAVIHAWHYWGESCFAKFNGMFAIALYDLKQQQMLLVRDRLGIKPLYYYKTEGSLIFASEIKSLLAGLKSSKPDIDPAGLNQYLTYQNYFGERTLTKNVKLLRPGNILFFSMRGTTEIKTYWKLSFDVEHSDVNFNTAVAQYKDIFQASVNRHLLSDVPVASYLSAGFDSAAVANRAVAAGYSPVCYTGRFDKEGWYDESSMAAQMADYNGSEHVAVDITSSDLPRVMDKLVSALDEPRMGMGAFSQYCVAEQAAKNHKVILSGHGGDELFSGYPVFKIAYFMHGLKHSPLQTMRHLSNIRITELPHLAYFVFSSLKPRIYRQFLPVLHSPYSLHQGLRRVWWEVICEQSADDEMMSLDVACRDQMQVMYSHYLQGYLHGLLVVEDKLSMTHSLETRTPILDNEMLEFSVSLPQHIKLYHGILKAVVKAGGRDWLPSTLYNQPKRGFPTPLRFWLRKPLKSWFIERMTGEHSALRELFTDAWLNKQCHNYLKSAGQNIRVLDEIQTHRMWQLLSLESWLRQNL